jgi:tRNA dimethylallyltransferase
MPINKEKYDLPKIIAVLGPTSSGKSDLAVLLALKFGGEVISADSRQVYRGLDIATGKITKEEMNGVPHHLLDVANMKERYTVSHFKREAETAIDDILLRGKLPILSGGTMQYVNAVTENFLTPETPPDNDLRSELEKMSTRDLFEKLKHLDPRRAENIDEDNPRRLIRAIEICRSLGFVPDFLQSQKKYNTLKIGISIDRDVLRSHISERLEKRMRIGMVDEAKKLHENGLSFERMKEFGLEYRYLAEHLEGKISEEEMKDKIFFKNWQYSKRQMTWMKRDETIRWFSDSEFDAICSEVEKFIKETP